MAFASPLTWFVAVVTLWPLQAQAHPDVATDAGMLSYVVATAATMLLLLAVLFLPRLISHIWSIGRRRLARGATGRETNHE